MYPREYARLLFKRNGYDDIDSITSDCLDRFQKTPTQEQLDAYGMDIVMTVRKNDVDTAKRLYREKKFDCNACNRFGESILHIACRRGHLQMVQFLVEEVGLNVHTIRDDYDRTPLHDAFWTTKASPTVIDFLIRQPYVVELLLLKDKRGYTPLDYGRCEDRQQWFTFLQQRKQLLVPTNKDVITKKNDKDIMDALAENCGTGGYKR